MMKKKNESSSSKTEAEKVRRPNLILRDLWNSCEEWSSYGVGVPLSIENIEHEITQYYAPSLSAIQIFTIKPYSDDSSSRSSDLGNCCGETTSDKPNGDDKDELLAADKLGYLYMEYNETKMPYERDPLFETISELAGQYNGLHNLSSSDLSPYSWISVAWYPIYQIPAVKSKKELSAAFLTYHSLKPFFSVTCSQDNNKVNENGKSSTEAVLTTFGALTYKAFGNVWIMPGTSDLEKTKRLEDSASSWLNTLSFKHNDFEFFMSRNFYSLPFNSQPPNPTW